VLRPEIAALSMSGSSLIVALNALMLKRLKLPTPPEPQPSPQTPAPEPAPTGSR
jgi:P-type Cu2+ transporter